MSQAMLRQAKADGIEAQDVWTTLQAGIAQRAKADKWRPSEQAAMLAEVALHLRRVYGKRATRFLFEDRGLT